MSEDRNHTSLRADYVRDILPEYFVADYPNLIQFLETYYDALDSDGNFGGTIKDLYEIRDIGKTDLKYLDNLFGEIGLSLSSQFVSNPREILKNLAKFFRVKGSLYSAEGFFRGFFDTSAEVEYPKDKIFTLDDPLSILGSKSSKKIQDGRLHQVLSHLIKTTVPLKDWEQLYKKFVHPAGFYLHGEAQLYTNPKYKPVGVLSDATPLNLRVETDSALPKLAVDTRIISKTDMGNSDILIMDGHKEYVCGSNTRRFQYANILDYADSEGWFVEDSYGRALEGPGLSVKNSVDAGLYSNKEINIAAIDLSPTLKSEDSNYQPGLSEVPGEPYTIFEAAPAKIKTLDAITGITTSSTLIQIDVPLQLNKTLEQITRGDSKTYISRIYLNGDYSSTKLDIALPGLGDSFGGDHFCIGGDSDAANHSSYVVSASAPVLRVDNILDSYGMLDVNIKKTGSGTIEAKFNLSHKFNSIYEWIKYDSNAVFDINSFNYGDNQSMRNVTIQELRNKNMLYLKDAII